LKWQLGDQGKSDESKIRRLADDSGSGGGKRSGLSIISFSLVKHDDDDYDDDITDKKTNNKKKKTKKNRHSREKQI